MVRARMTLDTNCCGTITKCSEVGQECVILHVLAGAGKCTRCKWLWEMAPGIESTPLSLEKMVNAHALDIE